MGCGLNTSPFRFTSKHEKGGIHTPLGARYVIEGPMEAPNGRKPNVRSVWFQEGNLPPRLVTAYPLQEKPQHKRDDAP